MTIPDEITEAADCHQSVGRLVERRTVDVW